MAIPNNNILMQIKAILDEAWQSYDSNLAEKGFKLSQQAYDRALESNTILQVGQSLIAIAEYHRQRGKYHEVHRMVQEARQIYAEFSQDVWYLRGVAMQAFSYERLGDSSASLEMWQEMLDIANTLDHSIGRAMALRRIGLLHAFRGDKNLAIEYQNQSLKIYEDNQFVAGVANVLTNRSYIAWQDGDLELALDYGNQALIQHIEAGNVNTRALVLGILSVVNALLGQGDDALEQATEAKHFVVRANWHSTWVFVYKCIAQMYIAIGKTDEAFATLEFVMDIAGKADDLREVALIHGLYSDIFEDLGKYEDALYHRKQQLKVDSQLRDATSQTRFETLEVIHQTKQAQHDADTQRQLRAQDREYFEKLSRMKDEIMSMASHDLKNPLTTIGVVLYMLKRHLPNDDIEGFEYIARIERNLGQMRDLITNLLDLARFETGKSLNVEVHDIEAFLCEAYQDFELVAKKRGIHFHLDLSVDGCKLEMDIQAMRQVIFNLLSNALKFTFKDGTVTLAAKIEDDTVLIRVSDTGLGIPESDIPHIFERFYRVENDKQVGAIEGTGLGLSICKLIVEQHGGEIWLESKLGEGTTFYLTLPLESNAV